MRINNKSDNMYTEDSLRFNLKNKKNILKRYSEGIKTIFTKLSWYKTIKSIKMHDCISK